MKKKKSVRREYKQQQWRGRQGECYRTELNLVLIIKQNNCTVTPGYPTHYEVWICSTRRAQCGLCHHHLLRQNAV